MLIFMIAIIIDSLERYSFFSRLIKSLDGKYPILLITSEPYAYFSAKKLKCQSCLIIRGYTDRGVTLVINNEINSDIVKSIEVINEDISINTAKKDYECTLASFIKLFEYYDVTKCIMWNGQQLLCRAATRACKLLNVSTTYIEIANLPGKLFVDPLGVNALSSIAKDISIIDKLPNVDEVKHSVWLSYYEMCKRKPLPQSKTNLMKKIKSGVNYLIKFIIPCVLRRKFSNVKISNSVKIKKITFVDSYFIENEMFIFLPLQVSGDTQIKLHSKYDNIAAIQYALGVSKRLELHLIVKIHPAEYSENEIKKILMLQAKYGFHISNANTTYLIKKAKKIITINSTVGLEGLLYKKDIEAIGNCFYKDFDQIRLMKYIHQYLIDGIDYFSDDPIGFDVSEKIINA